MKAESVTRSFVGVPLHGVTIQGFEEERVTAESLVVQDGRPGPQFVDCYVHKLKTRNIALSRTLFRNCRVGEIRASGPLILSDCILDRVVIEGRVSRLLLNCGTLASKPEP